MHVASAIASKSHLAEMRPRLLHGLLGSWRNYQLPTPFPGRCTRTLAPPLSQPRPSD